MAHNIQRPPKLSQTLVKVTTALTLGGSFLLLSCLTLAGTIIGLTIATPVLVLFSPILVPAIITTMMVIAGMMTSGAMGTSAMAIMYWMYNYVSGKHPMGADKIDRARASIASTAEDIKDRFKGATSKE